MDTSSLSITTDTHQNNLTETGAQVPGTMVSVADTLVGDLSTFVTTLNEESSIDIQPEHINIPLKQHQLALINYCKSIEKKLGIKIVSEKEPFYCKIHKTITNKCKSIICNKKKILISGTKIRNKLIKNKKIPSYLMSEDISKIINSKSLIN